MLTAKGILSSGDLFAMPTAQDATVARLPLAGRLVLDVSQGIAGPYCAALLATQGARVIKVEPMAGDWSRHIGVNLNGISALSIGVNAGKESVCLDTGSESGRAALGTLAAQADIIIESFRPGVAARIGLDADALRRERPELVFVSISGFGPEGPYAQRPGTDSVVQALSGMMHMNRDDDGSPRAVGMYAVDTATGLYAANAALAAILGVMLHGKGAHLQISLLECAAAFQAVPMIGDLLAEGQPPVPMTVPSGIFVTADGYLRVTSVSQKTFEAICRAVSRTEWLDDPRYATASSRAANAETLNAALAKRLEDEGNAVWLERMNAQGVLCAPVNDYRAALADPHIVATGVYAAVVQPEVGETPIPRTPGAIAPPKPAPALGADTKRILDEFGLSV